MIKMKMKTRTGIHHLLLVSLLALGVWSKKDKPELKESKFERFPQNLVYLEDSDVIFFVDAAEHNLYQSTNAGAKWTKHEDSEGEARAIFANPHDKNIAVIIGTRLTHWMTTDRGKSFNSFASSHEAHSQRPPLVFHATDPNRMLLYTQECYLCETQVTYTTKAFRTKPEPLPIKALTCLWAKSIPNFAEHNNDISDDELLCMVEGKFSFQETENRMMKSSDFFRNEKIEPTMSDDRAVSGVINIAAVKSYIVAAAKSAGTNELAMYVTDDTKTWHRAVFQDHTLQENAYTLLESTNYSMQVDVTSGNPQFGMGELLTSNSNGTFFRKNIEHTNRNIYGFVDFEKISNIQGIVMVNVVHNWQKVEGNLRTEKELKTKISFNDGRTWESLKAEDKELHLHSVTDQINIGRIFSSPAPGMVLGNGNTGKYLKASDESDLYVSDDAGLTWKLALQGEHFYEFGNQGALLVAIENKETDVLMYSVDHGQNWEAFGLQDLGVDGKIKPIGLTTTPDSTSLKFLLIAETKNEKPYSIIALDFDDLHERKCEDSDFENWIARVDDNNEPICIMGHTQTFRRRKADAKCFVDDELREPEPETTDCKCNVQDFECDYEQGFYLNDDNDCVPSRGFKIPEGKCEDLDADFEGPSGYRVIPGNTCVRKGGKELDEPKKWQCKDALDIEPSHDGITKEINVGFDNAEEFVEYYYLERSETSQGEDETVVMRTDQRIVYISHDHGKTWSTPRVLEGEEVVAIYPHQYNHDSIYFITPSKTVYYSQDRGQQMHKFAAPEAPVHKGQVLQFHPEEKDWLIWTGERDGQTIAHVSMNGGEDWETLLRFVRKCQFVYRHDRKGSEKLIYCEQHDMESSDGPLNLISSDDFFDQKTELKRDVIDFAMMGEFIVVAVREDQQSLKVDASIDGLTFADAKFPHNFKVEHQQAYTVLDSSTHAIFLHVTVNSREEQEYGSILKSNSNGTSYVVSVNEVNRNEPGYVDFEKMQGLDGVAIINRVANIEQVNAGSSKKLKTYITHNDGAEWALIAVPEAPRNEPDAFPCSQTSEDCSLHLHGYTERKDSRHTYSSPSAVGLMAATGNVGAFLTTSKEANTFVTRDGGITWHMVFKGTWMWEFGDQGSVLVMVLKRTVTKIIKYSLDEGITWGSYEFSNTDMIVEDITTVPSDTSLNFLLWGKIGSDLATVNIDFSGLPERAKKCELDDNHPTANDYDLWEPSHPLSDDEHCLFGRVMQYHRKRPDRKCYNGIKPEHLHDISKNCSCTRLDFECDYNYETQADGSCMLIAGLEPPDANAVCAKDKNRAEYYDITGYRRIPITTCEGGMELDYTSRSRPCPDHEDEYLERHGISGAGLFFAIVIPILAAAGIGYWVYKNWDDQFGRIRLGGGGDFGSGGGDAPWIKYPVMALSGVVAVAAALPMVVGSVWRFASVRFGGIGGGGGREAYSQRPFTSRSSFSRGRGDYAMVDPDEGELLGEDSEDEV